MRVVDTSAWIEYLMNSRFGHRIQPELPPPDSWVVPTIVQLELTKWLLRERSQEVADDVLAFTETCVVVDLTTEIAIAAAELCTQFKLPTADAIVFGTAQALDADLLTCDRHFQGLPRVVFLPKADN